MRAAAPENNFALIRKLWVHLSHAVPSPLNRYIRIEDL
jgi:hypothetical protein